MSWQPIETAKDDEEVILCAADVGWMRIDFPPQHESNPWLTDWCDASGRAHYPTHWMPKPELPK